MSCLKDAGGPQFQDLVIKKLELCTSFDHDDVESLAKIACACANAGEVALQEKGWGRNKQVHSRMCCIEMRKAVTRFMLALKQQHTDVAGFVNAACLVKALYVDYHNGVEWFTSMLWEAICHIDYGTELDQETCEDERFRQILAQTTVHLSQNKKHLGKWL